MALRFTHTHTHTHTFPSLAWVPKAAGLFNRDGMHGWFDQTYQLVGTLHVPGVAVALHALVLWDSHSEGCLGHITQSAPRRQHFFLRNYFLNIQPLWCMIAKASYKPQLVDASPAMSFTKYMDNTYLGFCNIPNLICGVVCRFVEVLQNILYHVPFKWEPEGQVLHWGECAVMCNPHS